MENTTAVTTTAVNSWEAVRRGKGTVDRMGFGCGGGVASVKRAELRASGVRGRELNRRVNAFLSEGRQSALLSATACLQTLAMSGYIPDKVEKSAKSASIRLVRVEEPVVETPVVDPFEAVAAQLGVTVEALRALKA